MENRAGAAGTIAGALVAKSAPDGHTLLMHSSSSYNGGFLYRKLSYDGATAFAPVIRCAISGLYINHFQRDAARQQCEGTGRIGEASSE